MPPFAFTGRTKKSTGGAGEKADLGTGGVAPGGESGDPAEDARMEAAMGAMESEFANIDENDPRAMGRMMRRMSEITGEKLDGQFFDGKTEAVLYDYFDERSPVLKKFSVKRLKTYKVVGAT